jgi:hypothetical protein
MYLIARTNGNEAILGSRTGGILSQLFVWLTVGIEGLVAADLLYTTGMRNRTAAGLLNKKKAPILSGSGLAIRCADHEIIILARSFVFKRARP